MSAKIIIVLALILCIITPLQAQQASIVVPSKICGSAEIPLVYELNKRAFLYLDRSPKCQINYESDGLNFVFTVPTKPNYKPKALDVRDGDIFGDDRVELLLKTDDNSPYAHYAVNVAGTLADEKIHDRTWNSTADYSVSKGRDSWQVRIKIPFVDFGFDLSKSSKLKAIVAVYSGEPGNSFYSASVSVPVEFANTPFQTLVLSSTSPFLEKVHISKVSYDQRGRGTMSVDYRVKNPASESAAVEAAGKRTEIPGKSSCAISDKFSLSDGKSTSVILSIKDILDAPMEVKNDIIPQIDLVAQNWHTFKIKLYNQKDLAPYVKDMVVVIDTKKRLACPLAKLSSSRIDLRDLNPGPHEITYRFLNKNGTDFTSQTRIVSIFEPKPLAYDVSQLDASRYYKPVTFEAGKISFTRSRFDLSKGILPNQIEVDSRGILNQPIQLVFDGKVLPTDGKVKVVSSNKNSIVLKSVTKIGEKTLTITADHRYDGFTWYDVELSSKQPFEYGPLNVVAPLKLSDDILMSHDSLYEDALFRKSAEPEYSKTNSQTLPFGKLLGSGEKTDLPLTSFVGLATDTNEEYRGLFLINEGPRGWNIRNYDHVYGIDRTQNDLVSLALRISDGKTRWKRNAIKFGFGLIPVPLRNDIKNFHEYYRVDCNNNRTAFEPKIVSASGEKSTYLQNLAWNGVKITLSHEAWTDYECYWVEGKEDVRMPKYVAAAQQNGLKTIAYFGFLLSNKIPEFPLYHDLFLLKPNPYPDYGFSPYIYQGVGDPDQYAYGVCYASDYGDMLAQGITGAVRHYDWNGVFYDGGFGQLGGGCVNGKHGCGTTDPYGRLIYTFPIRNYRRLMEYVYNEGIKKDPGFIIDNHVAWPDPPIMGLMTTYWTGEASIFFDPQSRTEPGALRAMMNGKLYGVSCDLLRRPETVLDTAWAQGLLVNAYPRMVALGNANYSQRMWALYDKYGLTSDTFTPYFSGKNMVIKDNPNVFVSYYNTDKALVAVVSNYWSDKPQTVTLDLKAFGGLSTKCYDAWNNADIELTNKTVTTTVDPMWLKLLVLEKG